MGRARKQKQAKLTEGQKEMYAATADVIGDFGKRIYDHFKRQIDTNIATSKAKEEGEKEKKKPKGRESLPPFLRD